MSSYLGSPYPAPSLGQQESSGLRRPAPAVRRSLPARRKAAQLGMSPILGWMFFLATFVFALGVETSIGLPGDDTYLSRMVGYLFLLTTLLQPRLCYRRPPRLFGCFVAYLCVYMVLGALQDTALQSAIFARLFTLVQMLIWFWIAWNLVQREPLARGALLALAAASLLLAVLQVTGIGSTTSDSGRSSVLGQDPNWLASTYSLGMLAVIGLAYGPARTTTLRRLLVWPLCALLGIAIVLTGSRGGFLAMAAGLLALLPGPGNLWSRLRTSLIVLVAIGALTWYSSQSAVSRARWQDTMVAGDMSGRDRIYPAAWGMFLEKPIAGWGPLTHCSELGRRTNKSEGVCTTGRPYREAHNLFLWVLIECGLLGAIPFFTGIGLCLRAAWRARAGPHGSLPLAMMITLLAANLSTTQMCVKLDWLVLAYVVASGMRVHQKRSPRGARRRVSPRRPLRGARRPLSRSEAT